MPCDWLSEIRLNGVWQGLDLARLLEPSTLSGDRIEMPPEYRTVAASISCCNSRHIVERNPFPF